MDIALPISLDPAGQLVLQTDEVRYLAQDGVDVHDRDTKTERRRGVGVLTSHRLVWIDAERRAPLAWHLGHVVAVAEEEGTFLVGSAKIVIHLRTRFAVEAAASAAAAPTTHIKFAFKIGGRDEFLDAARTALGRRSWAAVAAAPPGVAPDAPLTADIVARPGVAGILERRERALESSKALATSAFADLAELEKHAKSLVALAERYAGEAAFRGQGQALLAHPAGSGQSGDAAAAAAAAAAEQRQLADLVATMGIIPNPVTRAACGSGSSAANLFFTEVARQLASFIAARLERGGGMMALTDVYCLYNRARSTDLISPDDLLAAARVLPDLRHPSVGMGLRTLPESGLLVLQLDSFNEAAAADRLVALLKGKTTAVTALAAPPSLRDDPFVSPITLSAAWGVSVQIAQHLLLVSSSIRWCMAEWLLFTV